jgi:hypothetical protein
MVRISGKGLRASLQHLFSNFSDMFAFYLVEDEIVNAVWFSGIPIALVHEPDDASEFVGHLSDGESIEHRDLDSASGAELV